MVVRQDIDSTSATLTVTLPREQVQSKLDAELKRFRQRVAIKGFRQGQAPMDYVRRMYGQSIFGDTLNDLFSKELYDYLRESNLDLLGQPLPAADQERFSSNINQLDPEYSVRYDVGFVAPFEIQGLDGSQQFERLVVANLDQLAEDDLQAARKRMGARTNPEDDIQENDIVRLAARELDGDQVKEDGWETTMSVLLKNIADDDFRQQLLGLKKGDTLRFNARAIEQAPNEPHYRKYVLNLPDDDDRMVGDMYEATIEEVSRVEDAELNEEFYKNYFGEGVTTHEEAIEELKKGVSQFYDVRANALLMREFQQRLMALNPIELPETFLKRWLGATNEGQLPPEQIEREFPAFADNLRWSLLRDKIKARFDLEVTEEEVQQEYLKRVRNYFRANLPDDLLMSSVQQLMKNEKDVENTRRDLETDKIFEAIRGEVTVVDKPIPSQEFQQIIDDVTKKAEAEQLEDAELRDTVAP
jgi:trigger factor